MVASGALGAPRGCWAIRGHQGVSRSIWGLAGSVGTQGPEGYRWQKGALGDHRGVGGH